MTRVKTIATLRKASPAILPSMLQCDFSDLRSEVRRLEAAGVSAIHLDVMDGSFVPNFTYGMTLVRAFRKVTDLVVDVHLMMVHPEKYLAQFAEAGADVMTFHAEAVSDPAPLIKTIHDLDCAAGIAINPDTPIDPLLPVLPELDVVLVMSVKAGFGGQEFNAQVLQKFHQIRASKGGADVLLEIDGGINADTIGEATKHGAQLLVAGSAIFKQTDYAAAITNMISQVNCVS